MPRSDFEPYAAKRTKAERRPENAHADDDAAAVADNYDNYNGNTDNPSHRR